LPAKVHYYILRSLLCNTLFSFSVKQNTIILQFQNAVPHSRSSTRNRHQDLILRSHQRHSSQRFPSQQIVLRIINKSFSPSKCDFHSLLFWRSQSERKSKKVSQKRDLRRKAFHQLERVATNFVEIATFRIVFY